MGILAAHVRFGVSKEEKIKVLVSFSTGSNVVFWCHRYLLFIAFSHQITKPLTDLDVSNTHISGKTKWTAQNMEILFLFLFHIFFYNYIYYTADLTPKWKNLNIRM